MLAPTPRRSGPRVLLVRLSALGDAIHGLPVACALRHSIPNVVTGWVVEGRTADLLEGHPAIDHVIRTPRGWLKSPRAVLDLRRRLRELRFDIAIDLQCLTKSAIAARLSGARRRMGMAGEDGREASRWLHNDLVEVQGEHVVDRYLSMLRPLGIKTPSVRFDLPEQPADAQTARQFLASHGLTPGCFAILNPGAGWPSKIWPAERYGEVAQRLAADHGLPSIAAWGGSAEKTLGEAIVAASGGAARLAPPTTVNELAALCRRAALFVGSDTGPMHLAVAVGTPTVSLHGTSRAERCGAYGPSNIRLQVRYHDGSSRERRQADNAAMRDISVDMAVGACRQLLAAAERKAG